MNLVGFVIPTDHRAKIKESKKMDILGPCQRAEKDVENEDDGDTICCRITWNSTQRLRKKDLGIL